MAFINRSPFTAQQAIERVVLERLRMSASRFLSGHALQSLSISSRADMMEDALDGMLVQLETEVLSDRCPEEKYTARFSFPADWWEMFKYRHFPRWLRRRFPIRWKTYKRNLHVTRFATYPQLNRVMPDDFGSMILKYSKYEDGDRLNGSEEG